MKKKSDILRQDHLNPKLLCVLYRSSIILERGYLHEVTKEKIVHSNQMPFVMDHKGANEGNTWELEKSVL